MITRSSELFKPIAQQNGRLYVYEDRIKSDLSKEEREELYSEYGIREVRSYRKIRDLYKNIRKSLGLLKKKDDIDERIHIDDYLGTYLNLVNRSFGGQVGVDFVRDPVPDGFYDAVYDKTCNLDGDIRIYEVVKEVLELLRDEDGKKRFREYLISRKYEENGERAETGRKIKEKNSNDFYIPPSFFDENADDVECFCKVNSFPYTREGNENIFLCECLACNARSASKDRPQYKNDWAGGCNCGENAFIVIKALSGQYDNLSDSEKKDLENLNKGLSDTLQMEDTVEAVADRIREPRIRDIFTKYYSKASKYARGRFCELFKQEVDSIEVSEDKAASDKLGRLYDRYKSMPESLKEELDLEHTFVSRLGSMDRLQNIRAYSNRLKPYDEIEAVFDNLPTLRELEKEFGDIPENYRSEFQEYQDGLAAKIKEAVNEGIDMIDTALSNLPLSDPKGYRESLITVYQDFEMLCMTDTGSTMAMKTGLKDRVDMAGKRLKLVDLGERIQECNALIETQGAQASIDLISGIMRDVTALDDDFRKQFEESAYAPDYDRLREAYNKTFLASFNAIIETDVEKIHDLNGLLESYIRLNPAVRNVLDSKGLSNDLWTKMDNCIGDVLSTYCEKTLGKDVSESDIRDIYADISGNMEEVQKRTEANQNYGRLLDNMSVVTNGFLQKRISAIEHTLNDYEGSMDLRSMYTNGRNLRNEYEQLTDEGKELFGRKGFLDRWRAADRTVSDAVMEAIDGCQPDSLNVESVQMIHDAISVLNDRERNWLLSEGYLRRLDDLENAAYETVFKKELDTLEDRIRSVDPEDEGAIDALNAIKGEMDMANSLYNNAMFKRGTGVLWECYYGRARRAQHIRKLKSLYASMESLYADGITPDTAECFVKIKKRVDDMNDTERAAFKRSPKHMQIYSELAQNYARYLDEERCLSTEHKVASLDPDSLDSLDELDSISAQVDGWGSGSVSDESLSSLRKAIAFKREEIQKGYREGARYRLLEAEYVRLKETEDVTEDTIRDAKTLGRNLELSDDDTRRIAAASSLSDRIRKLPNALTLVIRQKELDSLIGKANTYLNRDVTTDIDEIPKVVQQLESFDLSPLIDPDIHFRVLGEHEGDKVGTVDVQGLILKLNNKCKGYEDTERWIREASELKGNISLDYLEVKTAERLLDEYPKIYKTSEVDSLQEKLKIMTEVYHDDENKVVEELKDLMKMALENNAYAETLYRRYWAVQPTLSNHAKETLGSGFEEDMRRIIYMKNSDSIARFTTLVKLFAAGLDISYISKIEEELNKMDDMVKSSIGQKQFDKYVETKAEAYKQEIRIRCNKMEMYLNLKEYKMAEGEYQKLMSVPAQYRVDSDKEIIMLETRMEAKDND